MSNKRKRRKRLERFGLERTRIKRPVRFTPGPRVCEACERGEHPGYEHTIDGMPIVTPADIQRMRAGLS
jgi:hypothetical protein